MGTAETVRLKSFDIAALPLLDPVVDVSNANLGAEDIDGTAGTDLLHAYDLFFDYRSGALYVRALAAKRQLSAKDSSRRRDVGAGVEFGHERAAR